MTDDPQLPAVNGNGDLRALAKGVAFSGNALAVRSLDELMSFAQFMAKAGPMVGKAFRNNPGACMGIASQALRWDMDPFAVSQKAYVTGDNIGYEAQLITSVIHRHAPIEGRPKYTFDGEGASRRCTVTATLKGDTAPSVYTSPPLSTIKGNSPLWTKDPDQQLSYYAIRAWARRHCPEVILGCYSADELEDTAHVIRNERIVDEYDQRPPEEIAEARAAESGGPFINGELAKLLMAHYKGEFEAAQTREDADKLLKSFTRKYLAEGKRKVSENVEYAVTEYHAHALERIAPATPETAKEIWEALEGCADLDALEALWSSKSLQDTLGHLAAEELASLTTVYEARQEALG